MKRCPKCLSTYTDDTLRFCLTDGTILSRPNDPPETLRMPAPEVTDPRRNPETSPADFGLRASRNKKGLIYVGLAAFLILFLALVSVISWAAIRGWPGSTSSGSQSAKPNQNTSPPKETKEIKTEGQILYADDFSGDSLGNNWQVVSGDWFAKDGVLNGISNQKNSIGGPVWAAVTLNRDLPSNYSVSFRTRIVDGDLSELMLHLSTGRYVRAYLYDIDQDVVLGDGKFLTENKPGSNGLEENLKNLGGGPSVVSRAFPITKGNWYNVKVTAKDNTYTISVGGQLVVKYVDEKSLLNKEGTIGLISNGKMQYDDLKISAAEGQ